MKSWFGKSTLRHYKKNLGKTSHKISNSKYQISNQYQMPNNKNKNFDLEERTAKFGEDIIKFAKKIPRNTITIPIINQLIKAGTSVGANYCEADGAESKKDFEHKMGICKKEAKETKHWLRMVATAVPELKEESRKLWKEAQELTLIFSSSINSSKKKEDKKKKK